LAQAGTRFQLPASNDWASDTNQNRVSQPDRLHCTICSWIRSCARLLPNSVVGSCAGWTFTTKAMMLAEIVAKQTSQKFVLAISFVKSAAGADARSKFQTRALRLAGSIDQPTKLRRKKMPRATGAGRGKTSS
jgi:hypothetical protein